MTFESATQKCIRDHPYITSAKLWDRSRKCSILQTFSTIYTDLAGGSEKVQVYADILYGWFLRGKYLKVS